MSILTLESQPNFPVEDLTDANAALLELLLANQAILEQAHHTVEEGSLLFRIGHRAILANTGRFIENPKQLEAISNGIAKYEVISMTISPDQAMQLHNQAAAMTYFINPDTTLDYLTLVSDVRDNFSTEMPRTKSVIEESTPRHFLLYQEYVLAGAALARMAEIDVTRS